MHHSTIYYNVWFAPVFNGEDFKVITKDSYAAGRQLETQARQANDAESWERFADVKAQKGSYTLASLGYLNAAILCEADVARAEDYYRRAFQMAERAHAKDTATIISYRWAGLLERAGQQKAASEVYGRAADFFVAEEDWFLAADSAEHQAELLLAAGESIADFHRPVDLWQRNAQYWQERGDDDDYQWSLLRVDKYRALQAGED